MQVPKPLLLKHLYYLLIHLSSHPRSHKKEGADLNDLVFEIGPHGIRVKSKDICRLSYILFKELCKSFKQLLSSFHDVSPSRAAIGPASSHPDMLVVAEELNLLLRNCIIILDLLDFRPDLCLENGQVLLMIVRILSLLESTGRNEKNAISFEQLFSSESACGQDSFTTLLTKEFGASLSSLELSDSCIHLLSAMLEVI